MLASVIKSTLILNKATNMFGGNSQKLAGIFWEKS
jgi:hypothetical protein